MASTKMHEEIGAWKDKKLLAEWVKFHYSHSFNLIFWSGGLVLAIIVFIGTLVNNSEDMALKLSSMLIVAVLSIAFIILLKRISTNHKQASEDVKYLYKLVDENSTKRKS